MDKKGFTFSTGLTKILAIVAFIMVIMIFYILLYINKDSTHEFSISSSTANLHGKMMLHNLAYTPVDKEDYSVLALIDMIHQGKEKKEKLEYEISKILDMMEHRYKNTNNAGAFGKPVDCIQLYSFQADGPGIDITVNSKNLIRKKWAHLRWYTSSTWSERCYKDWDPDREENPNFNEESFIYTSLDGEKINIKLVTVMKRID